MGHGEKLTERAIRYVGDFRAVCNQVISCGLRLIRRPLQGTVLSWILYGGAAERASASGLLRTSTHGDRATRLAGGSRPLELHLCRAPFGVQRRAVSCAEDINPADAPSDSRGKLLRISGLHVTGPRHVSCPDFARKRSRHRGVFQVEPGSFGRVALGTEHLHEEEP